MGTAEECRYAEWWMRCWGLGYFERMLGTTESFRSDFTSFLSFMETRFINKLILDPVEYERVTPVMTPPAYREPVALDQTG